MPRMPKLHPIPALVIEATTAAATQLRRTQFLRVPAVLLPALHRRPTASALPLQALRHAAPPQLQVSVNIYTTPTQQQAQRRRLSSSGSLSYSKMATESEEQQYMAFLDKANRDADDATASAAATANAGGSRDGPFRATDAESEVAAVIRDAMGDIFYVSDADEPFEGVSLRYTGEGGLPDEEEFAKLIHHWDPPNAEIEIMGPTQWDPDGNYARVVDAVSEATKGNDVMVYKVVRDHSRVEYWVVSREDGGEGGARIVGVKALGVES